MFMFLLISVLRLYNTCAVPFVRISGPFLKWTKEEFKQMDQRTRKLMTLYKGLCPRDDVGRLYVSRREEGRGLTSIEDSVDVSRQRLKNYVQKRGGRLIATTRNNTNDTRTSGMTITRKRMWEERQIYGRFKWLTSDISHEETWTWQIKENLKRETESLLIAAQNNAIRTNHIKPRINKMQQNSKCRLCDHRNETINHVISECSKLAQKEYKTRHDWVGKVIY